MPGEINGPHFPEGEKPASVETVPVEPEDLMDSPYIETLAYTPPDERGNMVVDATWEDWEEASRDPRVQRFLGVASRLDPEEIRRMEAELDEEEL